MKRLNNKPVDMRCFECPQCHKQRMVRKPEHIVSQETREYKTRDGTPVTLLVDICDFCQVSNSKRHFEPSKADIRRLIKAIQEEGKLEEGQSLEELL